MARLEMHLSGGLGNQILQFYACLYLARLQNREPVLNLNRAAYSHSRFDITSFQLPCAIKRDNLRNKAYKLLPNLNKVQDRLLHKHSSHLIDAGFLGNVDLANNQQIKSASGHFVTFEYMLQSKNINLQLVNESQKYLEYKDLLENHPTLGVHVRRGDFLGQSEQHGCLSKEWYLDKIINLLTHNRDYELVMIFTNEKSWVEANLLKRLSVKQEIMIVDQFELQDPAESWRLLQNCKSLILANSSFSITSAVFSNSEMIISPAPFSRGRNYIEADQTLPKNWLRSSSIWE
jgi:hypothetical protein